MLPLCSPLSAFAHTARGNEGVKASQTGAGIPALWHWWAGGSLWHSLSESLFVGLLTADCQAVAKTKWMWCRWGDQPLAGHKVNAKLFLSPECGPLRVRTGCFSPFVCAIPTWLGQGCVFREPQQPALRGLRYPPQNHQPRGPKQRHCLGSKTRQLRPVYLGNALRTVQDATPLTHHPHHPQSYPVLPDPHTNLAFAGRGKISGSFWGTQLPSLIPFFPLGQQLLYESHFILKMENPQRSFPKGGQLSRSTAQWKEPEGYGRIPLCHMSAEQPWASGLTSLNLCFHVYKKRRRKRWQGFQWKDRVR